MALYKAEGIVLRTRNLGEADKIATLFTYERGKVDAVARGVRRPRSQFVGVSQAFTHGRYLLYKGKKDLDTMRQGEIVRSFGTLREDLHKMAYASYVSELVDRMTELNDPHPDVFALLLSVQQLLASADEFELSARWFEMQLMHRLGFQPHLDGCVQCGGDVARSFSAELGGLLCENCRAADVEAVRLDEETLEVMRYLARTPPTRLGVIKPSWRALTMLGETLPRFCALRIGRPLYTFQFLQSLRAAEQPAHGRKREMDR